MTTEDIILLVTGLVGVLVIIGLLIYCFAFELPRAMEKERIRREEKEAEYKKIFETEPEYVFKQAKVVAMRKYVYHKTELAMPMLPQQVDEYYVTFLTDDGEEKEYRVSEEFFFNVVKDEEGTLITVNGNFFDFGDGIDVVTDEETGAEENTEESAEE